MASGKLIENLKVTELKSELEARGCDSGGLKSVLVNRLKEAMKNQGEDPEWHVFEFPLTPKDSMKASVSDQTSSLEDISKTINSKNESKKPNSEDASSAKGCNSDSSKNVDEDSNLIVHVGDTFDLDYDLAGKRSAEERGVDHKEKSNDSTSARATPDVDDKAQSKNLWVSNIKDVKAAALRSHFSSVGKVIAARVFVNRTPRAQSKYYGFVQMATVEAADRAVKELNRSMINGQRIYVDKAKREVPVTAAKRPLNAAGGITTKKNVPSADTSKEAEKKTPAATSSPTTCTTSAPSKSEKQESKKESEKSSTSDRKNGRADDDIDKETIEMVKKKEEDLERLKQRQLKLAKTQQMEFDRLAREKEKLRHEREAIERERRNLRKIRKEVASSSDTSEGHHRKQRRSWEEPSRGRGSEDRTEASASHSRSFDVARYFTPRDQSKNFYRPSAPSGSERPSRHFDSEPHSSRGDRDGAPSYRRQDDRYSGGTSSYVGASRGEPAESGQRYRDFGGGEPSRGRPTTRYNYEQSVSRPRSSYEQSSSSGYRRDSDYGSDYTRDYSYNRQQPNASSSYYNKGYASEKSYQRDRSPLRSSDRHGGSSSNFTRHNPYYASTGGGFDRGIGSSHRGSNSAAMAPTFLGGSSSNLGGASSNGPSSSNPMFLGGGGGSSASSFPPSGSYYGAATVSSLAASALANSAAASSMRYDAYAAAAAASGRNVGGSMYHHSNRH